MLSIVRDDLSEAKDKLITLYLMRDYSDRTTLCPVERSLISSYILRNYPNENFSQVRLQFEDDGSTIIPIRTPI
ncbi:MAG: hypothetical protein JWN30_1458 [Bacilli bacterium]|nr:hypothetical protein [Bacilli bacterium]